MLIQHSLRHGWLALAGCLILSAATPAMAADYDEGVVRITDNKLPATPIYQASGEFYGPTAVGGAWSAGGGCASCGADGYGYGYGDSGCAGGRDGSCYGCEGGCDGEGCGDGTCGCIRCLERCHARLEAWKRCRFGYFMPDGCCGQGCPPKGCYHLLYAANPEYFDPRDGRVYSAQGYGIPVAVPLAPNVNHTWNYGWGIPSSRLTPVSRLPEWGP